MILLFYADYLNMFKYIKRLINSRNRPSREGGGSPLIDGDLVKYAMDLGVWHWNLETQQVTYDERWCEIVGYEVDELEDSLSTWEKLVHPEDLGPARESFGLYLSGKIDVYEVKFRMLHKSGKWVSVLAKGKVIAYKKDGSPLLFGGTHFDYSHFDKLEKENRKLDKLSNDVQKMAKIGGWDLDIETMETQWTDEIYRIHEIEIGSPTNKIQGLSFYADHEKEKISKYLSECMESGKNFSDEFEFYTNKGKKIWVKVRGEAQCNEEGKIIKLMGTFQDISEQKQMQMELDEERLKLLQSSKMATLGEMAAGIAHEINNPLAVISGNNEFLIKYADDPDKVLELQAKIDKSVRRVAKIISGLKKFSRRSSGVVSKQVSLKSILNECIELTSVKLKKSKVAIEVGSFDDEMLYCDDVQIEQVLVNLISNSADAVENLDERWIKILIEKESDLLAIVLQDSGAGIPKDKVSKLFDPFYTSKPQGRGTGLGLSISQAIAKEHNGDLLYKCIDKHTAFILKIPYKKRALAG